MGHCVISTVHEFLDHPELPLGLLRSLREGGFKFPAAFSMPSQTASYSENNKNSICIKGRTDCIIYHVLPTIIIRGEKCSGVRSQSYTFWNKN